MTTEELIKTFGEEHREIITKAIRFLENNEPYWKLEEPVDRFTYIQIILSKVSKQ